MTPRAAISYMITIALAGLGFAGCSTGRTGSSGSASGDVETFLVEGGITQYYVRPIHFDEKAGDEDVYADITFRHGPDVPDTATMNFSIVGERILKNLDAMTLAAGSDTATAFSTRNMFVEKDGSEVTSRFTAKLSRSRLYAIFGNPAWTITVVAAGTTSTFNASSSARSTIRDIDADLIQVLRAP